MSSFSSWVVRPFVLISLILFISGCGLSQNKSINDIAPPSVDKPARIVALGDSLTAGYGLDMSQSYPSQLEKKLRDNGYFYSVENAGVSGDTTAQLLDRIEWVLAGDNITAIILTIGSNDAFQSKNPENIKENIVKILDQIEQKGIPVLLAGMKAPLNLGTQYTSSFETIYQDISKHPTVKGYIPFLLEGVATRSELNLPDRIHPNEAGYAIITQTVYDALLQNKFIEK